MSFKISPISSRQLALTVRNVYISLALRVFEKRYCSIFIHWNKEILVNFILGPNFDLWEKKNVFLRNGFSHFKIQY